MSCFAARNKPTSMVSMRLKAVKHWVDDQFDAIGEQLDITNFTQAQMRKHQRMLARKTKDGDSGFTRKEETSSSASKTTHFDGKNHNWIPAKRSLMSKSNQSKNAQCASLFYVIRDPGKEE